MANNKLCRELEHSVTCSICQEHYTEPKVLPTCCHYYCKQCILRLVQKTGVDKSFSCPDCRRETTLSREDVDQLQTASFATRLKEFYYKLDQVFGKEKPHCCELCSGYCETESFCKECSQFICSKCDREHSLSGHRTLSLEELQEEGVKGGILQEPPVQICDQHDKPQKLFCFDCNSLICQDCTTKSHASHHHNFIDDAAPDAKKKLIEQLDPLKEMNLALKDAIQQIKSTEAEIEAQGHSVAKKIETSFQELVKILEKRKQELLKEATMEVTHKLECLHDQEKRLSTSQTVIDSTVEYTNQCVGHLANDEVMCMHVELGNQIAREIKEQRKVDKKSLKPAEEADIGVEMRCGKELEELCRVKAQIVHKVDFTNSVVTGQGTSSAEVNRDASFFINTKCKKKCKKKCMIDCHLRSLMTGSLVQCKIKTEKSGEYHVQYTPTLHGDHELIVTVNGEEVAGSPFPVCVSIHPTQLGKPAKIFTGLIRPFDVAVNSDGNIIVTEKHGDVVMFDREGRKLRSIKRSKHKFKFLNGVAVDQKDNIYFIDTQLSYVIYKTNKEMEIVLTTKSKYQSNDCFAYVAVVGDEVLLSATRNHDIIEVYNTNLEYIRKIIPRNIGPAVGSFHGIASDHRGILYISDANTKCIQMLGRNGEFLRSVARPRLSGPGGLCVAGQYVYVAEYDAHKISVYTCEGEYVTSFGRRGSADGNFDWPFGVCVDRHGLLYVCDYENNRVQVF